MAVRKSWIAVVILGVLAAPIAPGGTASVGGLGWAFATVAIFAATLMRVGLLAGVFALICVRLLTQSALTLNPQSWYFNSSVVVLAIIIAVATYGFMVSLAGQPAFGAKR